MIYKLKLAAYFNQNGLGSENLLYNTIYMSANIYNTKLTYDEMGVTVFATGESYESAEENAAEILYDKVLEGCFLQNVPEGPIASGWGVI